MTVYIWDDSTEWEQSTVFIQTDLPLHVVQRVVTRGKVIGVADAIDWFDEEHSKTLIQAAWGPGPDLLDTDFGEYTEWVLRDCVNHQKALIEEREDYIANRAKSDGDVKLAREQIARMALIMNNFETRLRSIVVDQLEP